ncbi:serine hydrolase [Patulibacter sp.]|uniref:serine hydrolase n=1 Tax=Patulibacter sp. TaxID=1912859 RepID=UPI00271A62F7|nr:serine hydrolase [Patulibacter sp.]MDO9409609.1 hypothetical protein [Patulibacter sp.]
MAARQAATPWIPDVAAARAYADRRPGTISFVVAQGARTWSSHGARTVPAASLMKTMFLVAHLRSGGVRGRALRAADRRLLDPMIRRSDDLAATRVRGLVGDARLRRLGRAARMRDLRLAAVWGLSRTSARDQVALFRRLDDLVPARHRAYARRLLETIVPSQRWGVGAVDLPAGWTLRFKGGWGSGTGAVDHQSALLVGEDGRRVVLSITTTRNRSHAGGKETLRGVAARLLRGLPAASATPADPGRRAASGARGPRRTLEGAASPARGLRRAPAADAGRCRAYRPGGWTTVKPLLLRRSGCQRLPKTPERPLVS